MRADRDPLIAEIKRHNPTHLKLHCGDDVQVVALSARKNRWEKLLALLDSVPWDVADCLDRDGALVGRVENPQAEDDQAEPVDDRKYLANLLVDVMKTTQQQTANQYNAQMAQFTELARAVVGTVKLTQETYAHAMRVSQQAAAQQALAQAAGSDDGGDEFMKLMSMMSMMRSAAPPPSSGQLASKPPRPPAPPAPPRSSSSSPDSKQASAEKAVA